MGVAIHSLFHCLHYSNYLNSSLFACLHVLYRVVFFNWASPEFVLAGK